MFAVIWDNIYLCQKWIAVEQRESKLNFWFVNDTHMEKLFYSIKYKNYWLAASDLFYMFTQSIKFYYTFYYHILWVQMFKNAIHQPSNSKNEWVLLPASFTVKFGLVFVLTLEEGFS